MNKSQFLTERIGTRFSKKEARLLRATAKRSNMTIAAIIRAIVLEEITPLEYL